jgi:hypothetical protein
MLFAGFFLNANSSPKYFYWLEYLSFLKYAFRYAVSASNSKSQSAALIGVFDGNKFGCEPDELRHGICPQTVSEETEHADSFSVRRASAGAIWNRHRHDCWKLHDPLGHGCVLLPPRILVFEIFQEGIK